MHLIVFLRLFLCTTLSFTCLLIYLLHIWVFIDLLHNLLCLSYLMDTRFALFISDQTTFVVLSLCNITTCLFFYLRHICLPTINLRVPLSTYHKTSYLLIPTTNSAYLCPAAIHRVLVCLLHSSVSLFIYFKNASICVSNHVIFFVYLIQRKQLYG